MRSAILATLTLFCAAPLGAQETSAAIHGAVYDSLGRPLAGVAVRVDGSTLGIGTDAAGEFRVPVGGQGIYRISMHLAGFIPRTFPVWIPEGFQGDYDLGQLLLSRFGEGFVTLSGTVRDSVSGEPVPGMTIGLDERVAAVTGRDGTFLVDNVRIGTTHLEARRIGYAPVVFDLDIIGGETFDLEIDAAPLAFPLEDVEIEATENPTTFGQLQGLLRRRERGIGYSFLRDEIEEEKPLYITDILRMVPGVQVRYSTMGMPYIVVRGCVGGKRGLPNVYVNGIQMDSAMAAGGLDGLIHPENVEAMEVHLGGYTPAEYRNYNACGVIAIWTR